jgi:lipocalin
MYERGKGTTLDQTRYFDPSKYWYHIATNARGEKSVWRQIQGKPTTCDNVITQYANAPDGSIAYRNACYVKGEYKKSLTRTGTMIPTQDPSLFQMIDSQGKKSSNLYILMTDYDRFSILGDGGRYFWIMSRTPEICGNFLGELEEKVRALGIDTSTLTVDFRVIKNCSKEPKAEGKSGGKKEEGNGKEEK